MRELAFPYGSQWSLLELLNHSCTFVLRDLGFKFISVHKGVLIKMQGYTKSYELSFWIELIN